MIIFLRLGTSIISRVGVDTFGTYIAFYKYTIHMKCTLRHGINKSHMLGGRNKYSSTTRTNSFTKPYRYYFIPIYIRFKCNFILYNNNKSPTANTKWSIVNLFRFRSYKDCKICTVHGYLITQHHAVATM